MIDNNIEPAWFTAMRAATKRPLRSLQLAAAEGTVSLGLLTCWSIGESSWIDAADVEAEVRPWGDE